MRPVALASLLWLSGGCKPLDSSSVSPDELTPEVTLTGSDVGAGYSADLEVVLKAGSRFVLLGEGDSLRVLHREADVELDPAEPGVEDSVFVADIPALLPGEPVAVVFVRDGLEKARATVWLPRLFEVLSASSGSVSRTTEVAFEYAELPLDPANPGYQPEMGVETSTLLTLSGECLSAWSDEVAAGGGEVTVPTSAVIATDVDGECEATFTLSRAMAGMSDNFATGTVAEGRFSTGFSFTSTP